MKQRRFDVVVFDWDGTLFDSVDWIVDCLQQAARDCHVPVPSRDAAKSVIGLGLAEALCTLFPAESKERLDALVACYRRRYLTREVTPRDLFEGVEEVLGELRSIGCELAIATGKARGGLERALRGTRVAHFFSATRCADETASKPDPAMLHQIIASSGVALDRAVMVGDTTHDLLMAAKAGIAGIAVTRGAHHREQLSALSPLACLDDLRELPALLSDF